MNILCYCEANSKTGFGHFTRVKIFISLIKKKYPQANITIFSKDRIKAKNFFKTKIVYKRKFYNFVFKNKEFFDLILIDPPYYDGENDNNLKYQLKKIFSIKNRIFNMWLMTDETKPSKYYCDFLINDYPNAINFKDYYLRINQNIKLFLGIYAFLYPDFILNKNLIAKKKYDLLIAFGGNDPKNLVKKYFNFLYNLNLKKIFIVNKNFYQKLKKKQNSTNLIKPILDQKKFFHYLNQSRLYLSTPSNIMFEGYAMDIFGIVIATQKRQEIMGKCFEKNLLVRSIGSYDKISIKNILFEILKSRKDVKLNFNSRNAIKMRKKIINYI